MRVLLAAATPLIVLAGASAVFDDEGSTVRTGNLGATPANNPFLISNPQSTNFQRADDQIKVDSFRVTAGYRF